MATEFQFRLEVDMSDDASRMDNEGPTPRAEIEQALEGKTAHMVPHFRVEEDSPNIDRVNSVRRGALTFASTLASLSSGIGWPVRAREFRYSSDHQTSNGRGHTALENVGRWNRVQPAAQPIDNLRR